MDSVLGMPGAPVKRGFRDLGWMGGEVLGSHDTVAVTGSEGWAWVWPLRRRYWLLVIGYWLLVIGYWLLESAAHPQSSISDPLGELGVLAVKFSGCGGERCVACGVTGSRGRAPEHAGARVLVRTHIHEINQ
jgi:hypothetical protein